MKSFDRALSRFLYKHPRFGIRNLMLYLIIGQALIFLIGIMDTTNTLYDYLVFNPKLIFQGQVWRIITFVFIPQFTEIGRIFWLALSMYLYFVFGRILESRLGTGRFTVYYLSGVFFTIVYGFVLYALGISPTLLNVSFVNYSLFFALATLLPDMQVLLFFFIPVKMKWLALVDALYFVYAIVVTFRILPFLPLIPILNYFLFFAYVLIDKIKGTAKHANTRMEFRTKVTRFKNFEKQKGYRHKCEVCGKTDGEYPDLEFRYCSRCSGYHCYCIDHINNHVHVTE